MNPPRGGPNTGPSTAGMVSSDIACTRSDFATVFSTTSRPTGTIMAPPKISGTRTFARNSACEASAVSRACGESLSLSAWLRTTINLFDRRFGVEEPPEQDGIQDLEEGRHLDRDRQRQLHQEARRD